MKLTFLLTPQTFLASASIAVGLLTAPVLATPQGPGGDGGPPPRPGGPMSGPGAGGRPPGFGPGTFLGPPIFEAADLDNNGKLTPGEAAKAAEKLIREADNDKQGSIDTDALARAINRLIGPPPGEGPDGGGPGGPPGGFGPGTMMAARIVEAIDTNKDGKLSPDEAARGAERFVRDADPKTTGSIDADALASAMNQRMGPPPGFGGPGGPMGAERKIIKDYDKSGDGRLDQAERQTARAALKAEREKTPARGGPGGRGGWGGPPGGGGREEPVSAGPKIAVASAQSYPGKSLYDPAIVRTLFLEFEESDWETALQDFHATDVEVPATLTVDGRQYPGVGVHFRGMSSYMGVREGHKRSLNLSMDAVDPKQRLLGYKTLNLLNSHEDPSFLHAILYLQAARSYIPAPKANLVQVVINGESWGIYTNAQQFDKVFLKENYPSDKGARWKVRGNPGADGGLTYVGDEVADYKSRYEIKTDDDEKDWKALIKLCKTLNQTPTDRLEAALKPMLDIEGVLWFLALDNALINGDGYWTRASDYTLFRDSKGQFHVIPHDANETFVPAMSFGPPGGFGRPGSGRPPGPGGPPGTGGPPGGGARPSGVKLDPLIGMDDARKPLRSKLLAIPALREKYLRHIRTIADDWLDWSKLGPVVAKYRTLIEADIAADTRKLTSTAAFLSAAGNETPAATADAPQPASPPRGPGNMSLKAFADQRRQYLLDHPEIQKVKP